VSEPPPLRPDRANGVETVAQTSHDVSADARGAGSRRVRELPPPPKPPATPKLPHPTLVVTATEASPSWWSNEGRVESSAWLVSFLVHSVVLFSMGLITLSTRPGGASVHLVASTNDAETATASFDRQPRLDKPDLQDGISLLNPVRDVTPLDVSFESPRVTLRSKKPAGSGDAPPSDVPPRSPSATAPSQPAALATGGGLEGRNPDARATAIGPRGGNRQSERAVERGLRWLAAHQRDDGSWSFDLKKPPCGGMCRNPGTESSTTAATGLALIPFLGAGYTHLEGEHKDIVKRGLYYLSTRAVVTPHGIDLRDGSTMYGQAIATIALCESYAMTRDPALKDIAQGAIRFIVHAQDLKGGGWRYTPGEPGDTTVTGWQLMALKSGQLARLQVPSPTIALVQKFLDSVQTDGGARYRYQAARKPEPTTTAVGLLCRMYTGWRRDNPALYQGVAYLHKWGPSETNIYYNYYASQVLHHWEGPEWQAWNRRLRDRLVDTQAAEGHEAGSWHFPDPYGDKGGRLYTTAMAVMTLEVYYRHMPLYDQRAVHDRF